MAIQNNLLLAAVFLLIIPLIRGIANLDSVRSAECLEQSVILIGILLIVPLAAAEQSKAIQEVLYTKKISQWIIMLLRLLTALLMLIIMTGIFAGIMVLNNCTFPYIPYVAGTVISAIALGSAGFFLSVLSNSAVVGYLASIGYFLFNFLGYISSESILYLFSMGTGNASTKIWLMGLSIVLIAITLIYKSRKKYC